MSSFIEQSACRGRHPSGFSAHQRRARSDLVARLLRQRRVARFIVAPGGFGKSYLAYEYAHVVFSFTHVFWINGRSPCFLRDIDANSMCSEIMRADRSPSLVVIEDLPPLDQERVLAFSQVIDCLLGHGNEVLVTCAPSCDAYADLHRDRMVLDGFDLMLDGEESRASLIDAARDGVDADDILPSEMVPCLRWGEDGPARLLAGLNREELAGDERLAIFTLLLLQNGCLSDAEAFMASPGAHGILESLAMRYPFLGIDLGEGVYAAARIDVPALAGGFGGDFDRMAQASSFPTRDDFAARCADALAVRGMRERAVAFMLAFSTKRSCAAWLVARGWDLVGALSPLSLVEAYACVERSVQRGRVSLYAMLSWAFVMLDDQAAAVSYASRAAQAQVGEESARAIGCVVLLRLGDEPARRKARACLRKMLALHVVQPSPPEHASEEHPDHAAIWPVLADLALAFDDDISQAVERTCQLIDQAEHGGFVDEPPTLMRCLLMAACAWTFDAVAANRARIGLPGDMQWAREAALPVPFVDAGCFEHMLRFACECVEGAALGRGRVDWFDMRLASALEAVYEYDPLSVVVMPAFSAMSAVRREQLILSIQRDAFRKGPKLRLLGSARVPASALTLSSTDRAPSPEAPSPVRPPIMTVTLFGGFEVRVGDEPLNPHLFARQKMRTLVAILVLNRGKEFTRERLAQMLWPTSSEASARKSFYSLWAKLRAALTVNGSCPYLLRDQYGCRLNPRLVVSDVMQLEQLCRTLLFGRAEEREWESIYAQISTDFAEVLLPGEGTNEIILALREHYHTQLVDALIAASTRMVATGETRGALWFAREALRRDATREDAYVAQMEAQIAAEQRAAAIDTYFACRRFLARDLGIDPSPRIVNLYRTIIEAEEEFV